MLTRAPPRPSKQPPQPQNQPRHPQYLIKRELGTPKQASQPPRSNELASDTPESLLELWRWIRKPWGRSAWYRMNWGVMRGQGRDFRWGGSQWLLVLLIRVREKNHLRRKRFLLPTSSCQKDFRIKRRHQQFCHMKVLNRILLISNSTMQILTGRIWPRDSLFCQTALNSINSILENKNRNLQAVD